MYMSMYEYSYFDYLVFHVHTEKEKKKFTQKKKYQENLKTSWNYCLVFLLLQKLKFCQSY